MEERAGREGGPSGRVVVVLLAVLLMALAGAAPAAAAEDLAAPRGAVGGVADPATGVLELTIVATDDGSGLFEATASLGGLALDRAGFGDEACVEGAASGCPATGTVVLHVPTTAVADGAHRLLVAVTDAAGNVAALVDRTITVNNTPPPQRTTVTIVIGSARPQNPSPGPGPDPPPGGGGPARCAAPRLTMALASRPLGYRRGVPVLAALRAYRFAGRLTCRIAGRRRPAPRGTWVGLRTRRPGRTFVRRSLRVGRNGLIVARLAFRNPRVRIVAFRVRDANGDVAAVRLAIRVVRVRGSRR